MGRSPCCSGDEELNRGAWTAKEDKMLIEYINTHGKGGWRSLPKKAGLKRCGKSCRLRWLNYLRPNIKRGNISPDEEDLILRLHRLLGNRWSLIASRLPGRTDNEIKNYWNTHLGKKQGMRQSSCPKALQVKQSIPAPIQKRSSSFGKSQKLNAGSRSIDADMVRTRHVTSSETVGIPDGRDATTGNSQQGRHSFELGRLISDDHDTPMITSNNIPGIHLSSIEMQSDYPWTPFSSFIDQKFAHNSENYVTAGSDGISQGVINFEELFSPNDNLTRLSSPCNSNVFLEEFFVGSLVIEPTNDFDQMRSFDNNKKKNSTINGDDKQGMTEMYNNALELVDRMYEECFQSPANQPADSTSDEQWQEEDRQIIVDIL